MVTFVSSHPLQGGTAYLFPGETDAMGMPCACKIMVNAEYDYLLENEYRALMRLCGSSFVPRVYGLSRAVLPGTELDGRLMLTEQWVQGVSLERVMQAFSGHVLPASFMAGLTYEALGAAETICGAHLVYRDYHPGNLFLTLEGHLAIVDFGTALPQGVDDDLRVVNGFQVQACVPATPATDVYMLANCLVAVWFGKKMRPGELPDNDLGRFFRKCLEGRFIDAAQALSFLKCMVSLPPERLTRVAMALLARFLLAGDDGVCSPHLPKRERVACLTTQRG